MSRLTLIFSEWKTFMEGVEVYKEECSDIMYIFAMNQRYTVWTDSTFSYCSTQKTINYISTLLCKTHCVKQVVSGPVRLADSASSVVRVG